MEVPIGGQLAPLQYQRDVVEYLQRHEPEVWTMFASAKARADYLEGLRAALLRSTCRLETDAHPDVFEAASHAAGALGLELPLSVYHAEGASEPNAALVFVPDALIVVLSGGILSLLDSEELRVVFGHEFAHHRLWTLEDSAFLTADRLLNAVADDSRSGPSHAETRRRYALATELFADRGSFAAAGSLDLAVAGLVKVATGLSSVSGAAYLRQAEQVLASDETPSSGVTHPETFIRVHGLRQWAESQPMSAWDLIDGQLDVDCLDLLGQAQLESLTCAMIGDLIRPDWFRTDAVMGHARQFAPRIESMLPPPSSVNGAGPLAESTRRYLAYVLLDFATVDPDLDRVPLVECLAQATRASPRRPVEISPMCSARSRRRSSSFAPRNSPGCRRTRPNVSCNSSSRRHHELVPRATRQSDRRARPQRRRRRQRRRPSVARGRVSA